MEKLEDIAWDKFSKGLIKEVTPKILELEYLGQFYEPKHLIESYNNYIRGVYNVSRK